MSPLDYLVIVIFSVIILVSGLSFKNSGTDMKSYFAAGGEVPWPISSLSLFMSFFSAGTFVVWGSIAYQLGVVAISIQLTMCVAGLLVGAFIAGRWKRSGALTAAQFIKERLGAKAQQFYTYIILFLSLAYTGAFLYPVAKLVHVSTDISIHLSIIVLGLLVIAYTVVGGLWAVIITDVLQFVILTAAVLIVVFLSLKDIGPVDAFLASAPEHFFSPTAGEYSMTFILGFMIYNLIFIGGNWAYVQRYTSVKDEKSSRKVGYLFGMLYLVSPFIWMLPPMIYRITNPGLSGLENEGAYLLACKEVLPVGMLGLMLGGMIFATASSVNTTLNMAAAILTNDVFKPMRPGATEQDLMRFAKLATLFFGLATICVALLVPAAGGIVEVVLTVGAVTGCSLYGPPIWALFSKRQSGRSIMTITILSLGVNLFMKFASPVLLSFSFSRAQEMLFGALVPFILLGVYEFMLSRSLKESSDYVHYKFLIDQRKQLDDNTPAVQSESSQNRYGLNVLANTLLLIGLLIVAIGWYNSDSVLLVTLVGGAIIVSALVISPRISLTKS
ncbi:SSS family transporter [Dyadobacter jejuensis]|uniref:SSS family transporter n=1 Tax=Dyadobacter jejuensis TaxID=1082580 RepID=A0A316ALJ2_9BACT|nr:sodium:solute symporter family protein [Dyadobacter jejuensis]PWJ57924.1 SSS family transporter [Dyadobacter jejuensis]